MAHRLICLDMDGTLIRSYMESPGKEYGEIEVLPRRAAVIEKLAGEGCSFAIVTNQAGVAMGYQKPHEVYDKIARVLERLPAMAPVSVHVCMHHPAARVAAWRGGEHRRKPAAGMLVEALALHDVRDEEAIFVGDESKDRAAAELARIAFDDAEHFFAHAVRLHV